MAIFEDVEVLWEQNKPVFMPKILTNTENKEYFLDVQRRENSNVDK